MSEKPNMPEKPTYKQLEAMYQAAKGDLEDVLRSRDKTTELLFEAQEELEKLKAQYA